MMTCHEPGCSAPAEEYDEPFALNGVTHHGDVRVWHQKVRCAAGHHYWIEIYEEDVVSV